MGSIDGVDCIGTFLETGPVRSTLCEPDVFVDGLANFTCHVHEDVWLRVPPEGHNIVAHIINRALNNS